MKKLTSLTLMAVALLMVPSFAAPGDDNKDAKPADAAPPPAKKTKGMPLNGKVSSVDKTAKTITVGETEKARVLQVTSETKIYKNNKPATFDDVVVGEKIGAYVRPNAEGKMEIVTLRAGALAPKGKQEEKKPAN